MLRRSVVSEAPALERILLMLIRSEKTHARSPEKTRRVDSHEVGQEHYEDEPNNNEQSIFGFGRSQKRMAVCDFIAAQKDTEDQNSDRDAHQTNE
jgi:hypothetical protein